MTNATPRIDSQCLMAWKTWVPVPIRPASDGGWLVVGNKPWFKKKVTDRGRTTIDILGDGGLVRMAFPSCAAPPRLPPRWTCKAVLIAQLATIMRSSAGRQTSAHGAVGRPSPNCVTHMSKSRRCAADFHAAIN